MRKVNEPSESDDGLGELKARYDRLNRQKIEADTRLNLAQTQLAELQAEARRQFGTDDIEELERQLQSIKAENERKRTEYEAELTRIEHDLSQIEQEFSDVTDS